MFANSMSKIAAFVNDQGNVTYFEGLNEKLITNLQTFLDPTDQLYKDIFTYENDTSANLHSQHIGYLSLLPMIFGLVDENSDQFSQIMSLLKQDSVIWTPYGIQSLSRNDTYFQ